MYFPILLNHQDYNEGFKLIEVEQRSTFGKKLPLAQAKQVFVSTRAKYSTPFDMSKAKCSHCKSEANCSLWH